MCVKLVSRLAACGGLAANRLANKIEGVRLERDRVSEMPEYRQPHTQDYQFQNHRCPASAGVMASIRLRRFATVVGYHLPPLAVLIPR